MTAQKVPASPRVCRPTRAELPHAGSAHVWERASPNIHEPWRRRHTVHRRCQRLYRTHPRGGTRVQRRVAHTHKERGWKGGGRRAEVAKLVPVTCVGIDTTKNTKPPERRWLAHRGKQVRITKTSDDVVTLTVKFYDNCSSSCACIVLDNNLSSLVHLLAPLQILFRF